MHREHSAAASQAAGEMKMYAITGITGKVGGAHARKGSISIGQVITTLIQA
jgi:hypothetical protein